jgi:hypothetical protein
LIFLDTNVVSEFAKPKLSATVLEWVERHDSELALSSVVIGEIGYGIEQIRPRNGRPVCKRPSPAFGKDSPAALTFLTKRLPLSMAASWETPSGKAVPCPFQTA